MVIVAAQGQGNNEVTGREADLIHATHYANELMLRLMVPPGLLASGSEEEKQKAAAEKPPTQAQISSYLEKVAKAYDCNVVENTTSWLFARNEIEGEKKIIVSPANGVRGEGVPAVGEVWGVEVGLSLGSGKVKDYPQRATLHRRTTTTYILKRPSSRSTLSEIVKKFGQFPFSLRQLDDEKAAKVGVVECVRNGVLRQYEPAGDADNAPVSRLLTTLGMFFGSKWILLLQLVQQLTKPYSHHQERYPASGRSQDRRPFSVQDGQEDRRRGDPEDPGASSGPLYRQQDQQEQEEEDRQEGRRYSGVKRKRIYSFPFFTVMSPVCLDYSHLLHASAI